MDGKKKMIIVRSPQMFGTDHSDTVRSLCGLCEPPFLEHGVLSDGYQAKFSWRFPDDGMFFIRRFELVRFRKTDHRSDSVALGAESRISILTIYFWFSNLRVFLRTFFLKRRGL